MTDVFNSETAPAATPAVDPVVEKRLNDKDAFIEQLKSELAGMREEVKKATTAQAQLDELRAELTALKSNTQPRETTNPALSEGDIRALVERTITTTERTRADATNVQEANDALIGHFGGDRQKAADHVQAKAKELGVKVDFLRDMAAKSPSGFLKLMDAAKATTPVVDTTVRREVRTEAKELTTQGLKEGSYEYFENLRRNNPIEYWTPAVQQQIMKAAQDGTYKRTRAG